MHKFHIENKVLDICSDKKSMTASFLEGTGNPFKKSAGLNKSNLADILGMLDFRSGLIAIFHDYS